MLLAHDHSELDAALAEVFSALRAGEVEQSFKKLDFFWAHLALHIRAENIHLFPALLQASEKPSATAGVPARESVRKTIERLRVDHDFFMSELTAAMKQLRELRGGKGGEAAPVLAAVREQIACVRDRLAAHNELEESQVYQWAALFLDASEQKTLNEQLQRELTHLPPRFRAPREVL